MTSASIKKQLDSYLPLLTNKQQMLLLEMVKNFLNIEKDTKRASKKEYNKELDEAIARIQKGNFVSEAQALKELSKW